MGPPDLSYGGYHTRSPKEGEQYVELWLNASCYSHFDDKPTIGLMLQRMEKDSEGTAFFYHDMGMELTLEELRALRDATVEMVTRLETSDPIKTR